MKKLLLIAIFTILHTACIKEDTTHCPSFNTVTHYYTLNSSGNNLVDEEVDSLKIFVFDKDSILYLYKEVPELDQQTKTELRLAEGGYTLLTIGGDHSSHTIYDTATMSIPKIGSTELTALKVKLKQADDSTPQNEPSDLFISSPTAIESRSLEEIHNNVPLIKHVKTVNLLVIGAPEHTATLAIKHSTVNYDGDPDKSAQNVIYQKDGEGVGDSVNYSYKTMRLYSGDTTAKITLDITPQTKANNGNLEMSLMDAIAQNPKYSTQEDIDRESEFNVQMKFEQESRVVIAINDWIVNDIIPVF